MANEIEERARNLLLIISAISNFEEQRFTAVLE